MSEQVEYIVRRTGDGYTVAGPALRNPAAFDSEAKAIALCRHLIAAKAGGGVIIGPNGERDFYQGSRHLTTDGFQRR